MRGFLFLETVMNTPTTQDGWVSMPLDEFERLIEDAAERGAKRAMTDVGLDGESAAADIRELRGLLEAFNTAKHTAWQTLVRMVTTGFILALVAGALIKLKFFGGTDHADPARIIAGLPWQHLPGIPQAVSR